MGLRALPSIIAFRCSPHPDNGLRTWILCVHSFIAAAATWATHPNQSRKSGLNHRKCPDSRRRRRTKWRPPLGHFLPLAGSVEDNLFLAIVGEALSHHRADCSQDLIKLARWQRCCQQRRAKRLLHSHQVTAHMARRDVSKTPCLHDLADMQPRRQDHRRSFRAIAGHLDVAGTTHGESIRLPILLHDRGRPRIPCFPGSLGQLNAALHYSTTKPYRLPSNSTVYLPCQRLS